MLPNLYLFVIVSLVCSLVTARESAHADNRSGSDFHEVTGTLEALDLTNMKGLVKTDLGKPVFFQVIRPELFTGLSIGQRITVRLDAQGAAMKVIVIPVPEFKEPLSAIPRMRISHPPLKH